MRKLFYFVLLSSFFLSCNQRKGDTIIKNVRSVEPEDSSITLKITGEKLGLDLLCPLSIASVDTILLFYQEFEEEMVKAYSKNDFKYLGDFLRRGGGPEEVAMFGGFTQNVDQNGKSNVLIQSYPQYVAILDLQKTLTENKTVYERKYSFIDNERNSRFISSNFIYYISGDTLLLTKSPERSGKAEDGNVYYELYDYGSNEVLKSFYSTELPFVPNAYALYRGPLALKGDRKKIASFMTFMPVFSITDIMTGSSTQFFPFGKEKKIEKYIEKTGYYYLSASASNDLIVALYRNGVGPETLHNDDSGSYFHIFDWDGRLLYKLEVEDNIKCMTFDEHNKTIYAVLMNDEIKRYMLDDFI